HEFAHHLTHTVVPVIDRPAAVLEPAARILLWPAGSLHHSIEGQERVDSYLSHRGSFLEPRRKWSSRRSSVWLRPSSAPTSSIIRSRSPGVTKTIRVVRRVFSPSSSKVTVTRNCCKSLSSPPPWSYTNR